MAEPFTAIVELLALVIAVTFLTAAQLNSVTASALVSADTESTHTIVAYFAFAAGTAHTAATVVTAGLAITFRLTSHAISVDALVERIACSAASTTTITTTRLPITGRFAALELIADLIAATCPATGATEITAFKSLSGTIRLGRAQLAVHFAIFFTCRGAKKIPIVRAARRILLANARLAFTSTTACALFSDTTIGIRQTYIEVWMTRVVLLA